MSGFSRAIRLSSGFDCPLVGYGTFQSKNAEQLQTALKAAVQVGYRHIDTALAYSNEHIIGDILQDMEKSNVVQRREIFLTTKVMAMKREHMVPMLKQQLKQLKMSYVDLYLIHFPVPMKKVEGQILPIGKDGKLMLEMDTKIEETWQGMEDCVQMGLARSIGVSNFNISQVQRLLDSGQIKPAMNQIESHPGFQNVKLTKFCQENGVGVTAYSQFGSPGTVNTADGKIMCDKNYLEDPTLVSIGKKHGKTAAQVILRWQMQRNVFVIPKSTTPSRLAANFNVFDFELDEYDMADIATLDENKRFSYFALPGLKEHPEYPHKEAASC